MKVIDNYAPNNIGRVAKKYIPKMEKSIDLVTDSAGYLGEIWNALYVSTLEK